MVRSMPKVIFQCAKPFSSMQNLMPSDAKLSYSFKGSNFSILNWSRKSPLNKVVGDRISTKYDPPSFFAYSGRVRGGFEVLVCSFNIKSWDSIFPLFRGHLQLILNCRIVVRKALFLSTDLFHFFA